MNYCFNCGAELMDKDQKFCIKCGIDLREYKQRRENFNKDSRKKYEALKCESYNDYLERINSPIKDKIAADEEMESESAIHKDYAPLKWIRGAKMMFPAEEMEELVETYEIKENGKEVISEGMFGKPSVSTEGNYMVEGICGRPKYYIDGDIIRENNQFGRPAYRIDGNFIREGMYGRPKYYIDGDLIRENNQFGRVVGRRKK